MKNTQKHFLVAILLTVYGLGFSLLFAGGSFPEAVGQHEYTANHYLASPLADIGFHVPQSGSAVSNTTHLPYSFIKVDKVLSGIPSGFDVALGHTFKQLERGSLSLLLSIRKSDLLFPAHFFW